MVTQKPLDNIFWCVSHLTQVLAMVPLPRLLDRLEELDELEVVVVLRIRVLAQFGDLG